MRRGLPSRARRAVVALLLAAVPLSAAAQEAIFLPGRDEETEDREPLPSLPQGLTGTIRPLADSEPVRRIETIRGVFLAIQACWRPPRGSGYSGQELTIRMSFKRNGELLGQPRITYYRAGTSLEQREPFTRSVREAFERCTPLPFTEALGGAVAGRPFVFRFVDSRPM